MFQINTSKLLSLTKISECRGSFILRSLELSVVIWLIEIFTNIIIFTELQRYIRFRKPYQAQETAKLLKSKKNGNGE